MFVKNWVMTNIKKFKFRLDTGKKIWSSMIGRIFSKIESKSYLITRNESKKNIEFHSEIAFRAESCPFGNRNPFFWLALIRNVYAFLLFKSLHKKKKPNETKWKKNLNQTIIPPEEESVSLTSISFNSNRITPNNTFASHRVAEKKGQTEREF